MMRAFLLALILVFGVTGTDDAQTAQPTLERRYSGDELVSIYSAWSAIERQFHPSAGLSEFAVWYSVRPDGVITIRFFKPNTITRMENGDNVIHQDMLSFGAVIENGAVRVFQ